MEASVEKRVRNQHNGSRRFRHGAWYNVGKNGRARKTVARILRVLVWRDDDDHSLGDLVNSHLMKFILLKVS